MGGLAINKFTNKYIITSKTVSAKKNRQQGDGMGSDLEVLFGFIVVMVFEEVIFGLKLND